jgi:hypothetical protein
LGGAVVNPQLGLRGLHLTSNGAWAVDVDNSYGGVSHKATAIAYCGRATARVTATRTTKGLVTYSGPTAVTAQCPRNSLVIGGGFSTQGDHAFGFAGLKRIAPDKLQLSAMNHSSAVDVTTIAYCGPGPPPKPTSSETVMVSPGKTRTARAVCPAGTSLVFGGHEATQAFASVYPGPPYVVPIALNADSVNSWSVTGHDFGGYPGELTAIAYCR